MIGTKTLIKLTAFFCTVFEGYSVAKGQPFSPMAYCGAIATLFGGNSAHEHIQTYISQKKDITE